MNHQITLTKNNYDRALFKEALKTGFFELQLVRIFLLIPWGNFPCGVNVGWFWRTVAIRKICFGYASHKRYGVFEK